MLYTTTYIILCINYTLIKNKKNNKMKYHVKINKIMDLEGYLPFFKMVFLNCYLPFFKFSFNFIFGLYSVGY